MRCLLHERGSGDPMMFENFWKPQRNHHIYVSHADSLMSYIVEKPFGELTGPWYVHEELDDAIREIHAFVGNAITWDKKIVVGNGSTQLLQAALFALASKEPDATPAAVVAESPYYSVSNFSLVSTLSFFLCFKLFFLFTSEITLRYCKNRIHCQQPPLSSVEL